MRLIVAVFHLLALGFVLAGAVVFLSPIIANHHFPDWSDGSTFSGRVILGATIITAFAALFFSYKFFVQHALLSQRQTNKQLVLDSISEAFIIVDPDGKIALTNRLAQEIFMWSGAIPPINRDFRNLVGNGAVEAVISDALLRSITTAGKLVEHKSGNGHDLLLRVRTFIFGQNRRSPRTVGVLIADQTEAHRIQRDTVRTERIAALGRLGSTIAHEIKSPLTAIQQHMQLTREKLINLLPDARFAQISGNLDTVASELNRLNEYLETFTRLSGRKPLELQWISLENLIGEVLGLVRPQAATLKIRIDVKIAPALPQIRCDPGAIKQVFINIINNAFAAMSESGSLSLAVEHRLPGDRMIIVIGDNGSGIPAETLDKIFDLYFTTKKKGTGIGLSVALDIVHRHHGTIDVKSELGKGTTVRIELPIIGTWLKESHSNVI